MKIPFLIVSALLLMAEHGFTQERKPTSIAELATYRGPDREAVLYAGAKTEGKVTWYTSLAGASYKELAKAFSAKYPGVEVEPFPAPGADLVVRLEEEAKAGRKIADSIETTEGSLLFLRDEKLIRPYDSPYLDKYPKDGKERAKKGACLLGAGAGILCRLHLQHQASAEGSGAKGFFGSTAPGA
jgi:ABC-type glycerol-3-phosphate transport system substrate-binding protein